MLPGLRVVRGPDWCQGDLDGGVGYLGTVVKTLSNNSVVVQWDVGTESICRAGQNGTHDLRVYDNAQIGVDYEGVECDGKCYETEDRHLYGMRWKCLVCYDKDNCTSCYMNLADACTSHPFVRYFSAYSLVVRVPPRHHSHKIPLYGIFPGAKVTKRVSEQVGIVKELINMGEFHRSAVKVDWVESAPKSISDDEVPFYRIGADGKMELKLLSAVSPGMIYIEHLPVLDLTAPMMTELKQGDKVRMDHNLDTFQALMKEYGGWVPELENVLGEEGTVIDVKDSRRRIVAVKYDNLDMTTHAMYTNVLTKITRISAGDVVDITENEAKMKQLQQQHGGWQPSLKTILGATGKVIRVDGSTEAVVEVSGETYLLNISCLTVWPTESESHDFSRSLSRDKSLKVPLTAQLKRLEDDRKYVGARVVRGPDWSPDFADQDGGEGHLGTVVEVYGLKTDDSHPQQCATVQWDSGEKNVYRAGLENVFDLRIYDNASLGVKHDISCSECKIDVIFGMLWRCHECPDVNLCSECYNSDVHDIEHKFVRIDSSDNNEGTQVPKRSISKKLPAVGLFEKCQVRRGPDWRWNDQDGGEGKYGEVIAIVNFSPETDRDAVEITWGNGYTNVYRYGYRGRLDVLCVNPVSGGHYYRDHIPILKLTAESMAGNVTLSNIQDVEEVVVDKESARFEEGDKVRIEIDVDVLKLIEENRGSWNHQMVECIGRVGTVLVTKSDNITVDFQEAGRWTFHESVLNKVREFVPGETVKVKDNIDTIRMLQTERGGWNDLMRRIVGKNGTIEAIDEDGDVQVCFGEYTWTLNPECCLPTQEKADFVREIDAEPDLIVQKSHQVPNTIEEKLEELFEVILTGEKDRVGGIVQRNPELTVMDLEGRFAVHCTAKCGQMEIMKILFNTASKETLLEMKDTQEMTPLLTAIEGDQVEMVRYLVTENANIAACNIKQQSGVHIAVAQRNVNMLNLLRDLGFSVNLKDELNQSPIFEALAQDDDAVIRIILDWPNVDVHYTDSIGFSPFFLSCRKGHTWVVEKILQIRPDEIIELKDDGFTGLHLATFNGNKDVVEVLLKQKRVQIDGVTTNGMTSVHLACSGGFVDIIILLGDAGANMSALNNSGQNCLHLYFEGISSRKDDNMDHFKKIVEYLMIHNVPADKPDASHKLPEDYIDNKDLQVTYQRIKDTQFGKKLMVNSTMTVSGNDGETVDSASFDTTKNKDKPPAMCESCEEETASFKLTPCGHNMCGDCVPRKKQKKKLCALCGEPCAELTELP